MTDIVWTAFRNLKKTIIKLDREKRHIWFLTSCRRQKVIPKFIEIRDKLYSRHFKRQKIKFEEKVLSLTIRRKHSLINKLERKAIEAYEFLGDTAEAMILFPLLDRLEGIRELEKVKHTKTQEKKLQALVDSKRTCENNTKMKNIPFVNYSNCSFTEGELLLLKKGPKFIPKERCIAYDEFIPQIENALTSVDIENREQARSDIFQKLNSAKKKKESMKPYSQEFEALKNIKQKKNITIIRTDKSGKIAILDKRDYVEKMNDFIKENQYIEIKEDPNTSIINKLNVLINKGTWPKEIKKDIGRKNRTAITPMIFGQLKDHKPGLPLRPIVPKCQAPTYLLEKALVPILRECLPHSNYAIASTKEFIEIISKWKLEKQDKLVSLDIVSLYPSLDTKRAKENLYSMLNESQKYSKEEAETLMTAMNFITDNNFFKFNGKIYKQLDGAPMGSPISGPLAEYILRPLEKKMDKMEGKKPKSLVRYVDDLLIIWGGSEDELIDYVERINKLDSKIKFTFEMEVDGRIPYLDVEINKTPNGQLKTKVYRKPMAGNTIMPADTCTMRMYKLAGIRSQIERAILVCKDDKIRQTEMRKIKELAQEAGYSARVVEEIYEGIKKRDAQKKKKKKEEKLKFGGTIDFWPQVSSKIKHVLKNYGVKIAIKPRPNLFIKIRNEKDKITETEKAGVYKIPFTNEKGENLNYIGQTIRKIRIRREEHKGYIRRKENTSELAKRANKENLEIHYDKTTRIAGFRTQMEGIFREAIEIKKNGKTCVSKPSIAISGIWNGLLFKNKKR